MTDHYQLLGQELMASCSATPAKALLYAEVEDGAISADVFFQLPTSATVLFRFAPEALRDRIYEFWESGENNIAPRSWAVIQFLVEAGRFTTDLTYPEQLDPEEGLPERRLRAIAKWFPGLVVDYTKPHG